MKGFKSFSEEDLTSDCLTSIVILVACVLSVFYLIAETRKRGGSLLHAHVQKVTSRVSEKSRTLPETK